MFKNFHFKVELTDQGTRLDKFLAEKMPDHSRAEIQKMIKDKKILINPSMDSTSSPQTAAKQLFAKASYKLKSGDIIEVELEKGEIGLVPDSSVKFGIIHDEKDFAVIDKPAGLVVYPGTKHEEKTLVNGLLSRWPEIKNVGEDPLRPGIAHRLDKDTSGLMIVAKNNSAFQYFKNLFKEKKIEKTYIALVHGKIEKQEGVIDFPIRRSRTNPVKQVAVKGKKGDPEAREAITSFRALKYFSDKAGSQYTLVEAMPKTGRMHQIRAHLAALGHSIVGDDIYKLSEEKSPEKVKRHLLHAASLKFVSMSGENMEFFSQLPEDFSGFVKELAESIDSPDFRNFL